MKKLDEKPAQEASLPVENQNVEEQLAKIEAATRKLELANKRFEANKAAAEAARVTRMLEGEGEAGHDNKKKQISAVEYAQAVMAGEVPK